MSWAEDPKNSRRVAYTLFGVSCLPHVEISFVGQCLDCRSLRSCRRWTAERKFASPIPPTATSGCQAPNRRVPVPTLQEFLALTPSQAPACCQQPGPGRQHLLLHDSKNKVWRVPALLAEEECKDGEASESGDIFLARGGAEARAGCAIFQEGISRQIRLLPDRVDPPADCEPSEDSLQQLSVPRRNSTPPVWMHWPLLRSAYFLGRHAANLSYFYKLKTWL